MRGQQISIEFPNSSEYLRLARLVAADAGSRAGFDYEEIDDVKLALTELCSFLMSGDGGVVNLEFMTDASGLTVEGRVPRQAAPPAELSERIVAALVDEHALTSEAAASTFRFRKNKRGD
jgi:serine/threonine-protein kinase RsbW